MTPELRRARITALVVGTMMVFAQIMLVYALVQQTEAERQQKIAKQLQMQNVQCKDEVTQLHKLRDDAMREAVRQLAIAEQQVKLLKKR